MGAVRRDGGFVTAVLVVSVFVFAAACSGDSEHIETVQDTRPDGGAAVAKPPKAGFASPIDGAASKRLPLLIEPANALRDLQTVKLTGHGFTPSAVIAVAQCWTPDGASGGADGCDLGTTATGAVVRPDGTFQMAVTVRQNISVGGRTIDCAAQPITSLCRFGAANVKDYDESGVVHLLLEPTAGAATPPTIVVAQTEGLSDGDDLIVTGTGFAANEPIQLAVCVVGGMSGQELCWRKNPVRTATADGEGRLATTITATRFVQTADGPGDCRSDPYGCRVVVRSSRSPNAVKVLFG
jgi:hypothetical protein